MKRYENSYMQPIDAIVKDGVLYILFETGDGRMAVQATIQEMSWSFPNQYIYEDSRMFSNDPRITGDMRLRLHQIEYRGDDNWKGDAGKSDQQISKQLAIPAPESKHK